MVDGPGTAGATPLCTVTDKCADEKVLQVSRQGGGSAQSVAGSYLVDGAVFGGIGFVLGLVVTFLVSRLDDDLSEEMDSLSELGTLTGLDVSTLDAVLWVFFEAQFVDIESTIEGAGESETETVALLSEASLPELVYTLLLAGTLVLVGFLLVRRVGAPNRRDAMLSGATLVVGYLPLALVGTFVSRASQSSSGFGTTTSLTVGPNLLLAAVLAGLVFPVVCGAVGGFLAFAQQPGAVRAR